MKKTYKFELPQSKELKSANTRVEDGKIFVDVEFKDKFHPNDGDFLVDKIYGCITIIYKSTNEDGAVISYAGLGSCYATKETKVGWGYTNDFRFATPEEKAAFLERLEKECHKKWNPEKKCLEDIYVPKFGDIVRIDHPDIHKYKRQYVISIFPDKKVPNTCTSGFFDICGLDMNGNVFFDTAYYNYGYVTPASESEKQELFDKLAEFGKWWNPETKKLEDVRWIPNFNEGYYFVNRRICIEKIYNVQSVLDKEMIEKGNCFKTVEAAQKVADKIKEIFKNSKVE